VSDIPNLKRIETQHVERCAHVKSQSPLDFHAAITMQPVTASALAPVTTLLCTECALAVSEAIVAAMQKGYEHANGVQR
jgi:hypothetical protein